MSRELNWVEMDFSLTMLKPVKQAKALEVVVMTVLAMVQNTICRTTVEVSLQVQV